MDFPWLLLVITRGLAAANYKGCVSSASHGTHGTPMAHHGTQDAQMKDGPAGETFRVSGQEWARNPKKTGWPGRRKNQIGRMAGRMTSLKLKETEQKCWFFCLIGRPALKSGEFYLWKIADCNSCSHCLLLPLGFGRSWFDLQWMFKSVERVGQWDTGIFLPRRTHHRFGETMPHQLRLRWASNNMAP